MKESLMIAVFIIIVFVVLQYIGKNIVMKKMTTSLEEEKYDAFFKTSQSILCFLFVFCRFNICINNTNTR